MHWMTLEWPYPLNCQRYPVYTVHSPPRPKCHSVSLYDKPFSRYNVVENRKCTEWPQNDLKHLTVKSTLYILNTHPKVKISLRFALRPAVFEIQCCRKSEFTEWPQNDLNHLAIKSTLYTMNIHPRGPTFTPFRSMVARYKNNWGFWLPHRVFQKCVKNQKLKISNPKQHFCEYHWEANSEKVWKDSKVNWGRSSVLTFWLP